MMVICVKINGIDARIYKIKRSFNFNDIVDKFDSVEIVSMNDIIYENSYIFVEGFIIACDDIEIVETLMEYFILEEV